jgi:hypothetical protein
MADQISPVAIYAAALSTVVAIWNFYQWWSKGPKLTGYTSPNMSVIGGIVPDPNTYLILTVSNRGDASTTITNLGLLGYANWCDYVRGKTTQAAVITPGGGLGSVIPYQLAPGGEFKGFAIRDSDIVNWSKKHLLFMCVWHTMSNKPFHTRVQPILIKGVSDG